jgi:hypothetical protein
VRDVAEPEKNKKKQKQNRRLGRVRAQCARHLFQRIQLISCKGLPNHAQQWAEPCRYAPIDNPNPDPNVKGYRRKDRKLKEENVVTHKSRRERKSKEKYK